MFDTCIVKAKTFGVIVQKIFCVWKNPLRLFLRMKMKENFPTATINLENQINQSVSTWLKQVTYIPNLAWKTRWKRGFNFSLANRKITFSATVRKFIHFEMTQLNIEYCELNTMNHRWITEREWKAAKKI